MTNNIPGKMQPKAAANATEGSVSWAVQERTSPCIRGIIYPGWRDVEIFENHKEALALATQLQKEHCIADQYRVQYAG